MMHYRTVITRIALASATLLTAACASSGATTTATPQEATIIPQNRTLAWPIKTREQVDLWLHGFALIQSDSTLVPYYRRGYRDEVTVLKNKANVFSQLDANIERLSSQLRQNPGLNSAQFVPLYFNSLEEMHTLIDHFVAANGRPAASEDHQRLIFAMLASNFQTPSDRAFLSLFASSLWDESAKFYHSYWGQQQRARSNVIDSAQAMWQNNIRPRFQRLLNNTQQRNGEILFSIPLGGEGRTVSGNATMPGMRITTAVTFPGRPSDVPEAFYVIVHELVGPIVNSAVSDNTTPVEQRNGTADRLTSIATVRLGLLAMEKILPELADGYARFYLAQAGRTPRSNPRAELVALFPLPDAIRDALIRQLAAIQDGI